VALAPEATSSGRMAAGGAGPPGGNGVVAGRGRTSRIFAGIATTRGDDAGTRDGGTGDEVAGPALSVGNDRAMCRGRLPWAVVAPVVGHTEAVGRRRDEGRPTRAGGIRAAVAAGGALVAGRLIGAGACVSEGAGEGNLGVEAGEGGTCAGGGEAGSEEPIMRGGGDVAAPAAPTEAATQVKADGAGDSEAGGVGPAGAPVGPGSAAEAAVVAVALLFSILQATGGVALGRGLGADLPKYDAAPRRQTAADRRCPWLQ